MLVIDTEVYKNYFLLALKKVGGTKIKTFEYFIDEPDGTVVNEIDSAVINHLFSKYESFGFNSLNFDLPIILAAMQNKTPRELKTIANQIIATNQPYFITLRELGIRLPSSWSHFDLINVSPGVASLKSYGGRLNCNKIQDLPIHHDAIISKREAEEIKNYCGNDLEVTELLYQSLKKQIDLRKSMSKMYGVDLRSKSDAQIAEAVLKVELEKVTGRSYGKPIFKEVETVRYQTPDVICFKSKQLKDMLDTILKEEFIVKDGKIVLPDSLKTPIILNKRAYQMGIGGLHSMEKSQFVRAKDDEFICDYDVASFYPSIILQQKLYPSQLGMPFLKVYQTIVERRLQAKKRAQEIVKEIAALKNKLAKLTV